MTFRSEPITANTPCKVLTLLTKTNNSLKMNRITTSALCQHPVSSVSTPIKWPVGSVSTPATVCQRQVLTLFPLITMPLGGLSAVSAPF